MERTSHTLTPKILTWIAVASGIVIIGIGVAKIFGRTININIPSPRGLLYTTNSGNESGKKPSFVNFFLFGIGSLHSSNGTGTLPPGSIIKVPPGTVGSATNPSNSTGTPPLGGIIKAPGNLTNALPPSGNNTSTLPTSTTTKEHNPPSSTLGGQQPQTQQTNIRASPS